MVKIRLYCHTDILNLSYEKKRRVHRTLKSRQMEAFWYSRGDPWRNHRHEPALSDGDGKCEDFQCRPLDAYPREYDQPQDCAHQNNTDSLDAC